MRSLEDKNKKVNTDTVRDNTKDAKAKIIMAHIKEY